MKVSKNILNVVLIAVVSIIMSGCTVMTSGAESVAEVPSLENQANRIVIGLKVSIKGDIIGLSLSDNFE